MEHLLVVRGKDAEVAAGSSLPQADLHERRHLQEWVLLNPQVLGPDVMVVTSEYDRWAADVDGTPARDRLDVLGLDASGRLVVVEIKRDLATRDVHLQAITYAALVSRFTSDTLAEAHCDFLVRRGESVDVAQSRDRLLQHVGGDLDPELLRSPRLVIVAGSFPKQVTHTAVWLSERKIDIDLIQVNLWRVGEQLVAGFSKIFPTPGAEIFTLAPAREDASAVNQRAEERVRSRNAVLTVVDAGVLPDGARLRIEPSHGTTGPIRAAIDDWLAELPARRFATWRNTTNKPLRWHADQDNYSPTGLANHVFTKVTGRKPDGIQGTMWWVIDGSHVPQDVDTTEWEALDGTSLVALAATATGVQRDWSDLHALLRKLPTGRWTTYGDIAAVIHSHPVPVGRHLATCGSCVAQWRVLNANGRVSDGFRWHDPTREDKPEDLLAADGIPMSNGVADRSRQLSRDELLALLDTSE
jgi:alkylated DNA nucleotide flippase Atl1